MEPQRDIGAPYRDYTWRPPQAYVDTWSRQEFAQGARSGGLRDALTAVLLARVVGGVTRRRR